MLGHTHIPPFIPRENMRHVVSVSGGKDSGATYLHALELLDGDFLAVCADTGNEHPETLEYVARLHERTGGPKVQIIKADFTVDLARKKRFLESVKAVARTKNPWPQERVDSALAHGLEATGVPFLDLCRSKGMFPSRIPAFCSQRLKRLPLLMVQHPLIDEGYNVFSWQGIRSEESLKRSCYPMWEQSPDSEGLTIYRPLMGWTLKDVVAIHQRHGLNLNPLYGMGFERVGCLPCINSSKNDIRITAQLFPWAIEKIRHWEEEVRAVSRLRRATFFHAATTPGSSGPAQIDEVVLWSKTLRGGKQYDIRSLMEPSTSDVCIYAGGLCE